MKQLISTLQVIQEAIAEAWYSWLVLMILNLLFALCWVTIVLGPPATFGLYYAVHSLATTNSTNWREFVEGAKRYALKSWLWMLANIAVVLTLRVSIDFYSRMVETAVLLMLTLVIGTLWFCVQFYAVPYFMEQENKQLRLAFRNALLTLLASPLYTLVLLIFVGFLLWISLSLPILLIIGVPALIAMLGTRAVRERLTTFNIAKAEQEIVGAE
jgi:uncharacterized membrane protein YesL